MFQKTVNLSIDVKIRNDSCYLRHNVVRDTYNIAGYIETNIFLDSVKINLPKNILWDILDSQNLLENFRKTTNEHIKALSEDFLEKCEGKTLKNHDYYRDVNISYYEKDNNFCIVVCTKDGILDMERAWNLYLDNEWEKYRYKGEIEERC